MAYPYYYAPLPISEGNPTRPYTRLLMLWAGDHDDPLECSLEIYDVRKAPTYEALSYTWGKEPAQTAIWADQRPLMIKPNLEAALRHIRLPTQARRLWIDAICIDQSNTYERSRQVRYMREVYKNSARAIVWLGLPTPGVEAAFERARRLHEIRQNISIPGTLYYNSKKTDSVDSDTGQAIISAALEGLPSDSKNSLQQVLTRSYFERIWCVQEIIASPWAVVKCGNSEIPFFALLAGIIEFADTSTSEMPINFWNFVYRKKFDVEYGKEQSSVIKGSVGALLFLLHCTETFKATDPRDKIFALYGISDEGIEPYIAGFHVCDVISKQTRSKPWRVLAKKMAKSSISKQENWHSYNISSALIPNYDRKVSDVYRDFTRYWLAKQPRHLEILNYVHHTNDLGVGEFPSWVPRWFEPPRCRIFGTSVFSTGIYGLGNSSIIHDNPDSGKSVYPDILSLDGFHVDRVESISELIYVPDNSQFPLESLWDQLFKYVTPEISYQDGDFLVRALCLTAMATFEGIHMQYGNHPSHLNEHFDKDKSRWQARMDAARYLVDNWPTFQPHCDIPLPLIDDAGSGDGSRALDGMIICLTNRRVFVTEKGRLGFGPELTKPGDEICVLFGGWTPFVLRPADSHHLLVGTSYVHDEYVMEGHMTGDVKCHRSSERVKTFHLR